MKRSIRRAFKKKELFQRKAFPAAAWSKDSKNGRYHLDFQASPLSQQSRTGKGILAVYLQCACRIGQMGPPSKANWIDGGNTVAAHKTQMLALVPPIRPFQTPAPNNRPNLNDFDAIVPIGDSLLQQYLAPLGISFGNIKNSWNTTTLLYWKSAMKIRLKDHNVDRGRTALVIGRCVWDILQVQRRVTSTTNNDRLGWFDHRQALLELLHHVNTTYPHVTLFWKSCSAMHIHVPFLYPHRNQAVRLGMQRRTKYMSSSRASELYTTQRDIILQAIEESKLSQTEQRLYFLDVYPAFFLSADE